MDLHEQYATWAEIDLSAIENNVRQVQALAGVPVMAVVKANAYGHGLAPVARAALRAGAAWGAIARLEEALELRQEGVECSLLLLGYVPPGRLDEAIAGRISFAVWDAWQVEAAEAAAVRVGAPARLHLKLDTGMSRLGVQPEAAVALARRIAAAPGVRFEGLFTHFARADEADPAAADAQEGILREVLAALKEQGLHPELVHAANSAAGIHRASTAFNLVRLGIAMYGLHPSAERPAPPSFRPALAWKTVISQVKQLPPGRGLSYGHEYTTRGHERIGTLAVGYGDGFRRTRGNQVLVGGQRVPVIGRVCMDQVLVQLDTVPEARPGDEVVLIGAQGDAALPAEEVAARWNTINYEVVCGISARVPRVYV